METITYFQIASENEAWESIQVFPVLNSKFLSNLNWKKLSSGAAIRLLSVALTLGVLSVAQETLAVQKAGNSGSSVANTQRCLKSLGYFNGPVTGNFGSLTRNAVSRFQQANRLPADGIVGQRTQQLLQSRCQSRIPGGNVSGVLQFGSRGAAVSALQQNLRQLGYFNGAITGYFGSETQQAVIRYQQSNGIRADGIVGGGTQEAIRISLGQNQYPPGGIGGDTLPNALNIGDRGPQVTQLQQNLRQLGYFKVNPSGYFGSTTQDAVAGFQRDYRLTVNGIADSQTLATITRVLQSQSSGCVASRGDICLGERSQRVEVVQRRLQELGFLTANATGYYGAATRDAVAQFQRYYRLTATGNVDFQTWQALGVGNSTGSNPGAENRYVVVVPIYNNDTLYKVQQYVPQAVADKSRLGAYVNAGRYSDRSSAERQSKFLRDRGFDARVEYF